MQLSKPYNISPIRCALQVYVAGLEAACAHLIASGSGSQGVQLLGTRLQELLDKQPESAVIQTCLLSILSSIAEHGDLEQWRSVQQYCQDYSQASDDIGGAPFRAAQLLTKAQLCQRIGEGEQVCPGQSRGGGNDCSIGLSSMPSAARLPSCKKSTRPSFPEESC